MEFLTLGDTTYSDKKKGQSSADKTNIILSVVGQGLEVKAQTELNNFVGGLTPEHQAYFKKVAKSKSTDQEKAIISALLNKYPKLKKNKTQQKDFREHVSNMLKTDTIQEGALKYLLERLLEVEKTKKKKEQQEDEAEQEDSEQPQEQAQPQDEGEAAEGEAPQAADTENSEEDYFSILPNKKELSENREKYGLLLGGILGASSELYKLKNLPEKTAINKEFKRLHKSLTENISSKQGEAISKLIKILKSSKSISTAEAYYYKITPQFSRGQSRDLRLLIRLGAESRNVKVPSFSKTVINSATGAGTGYALAKASKEVGYSDEDVDFYSEWEKEFNNTDCDLTEDDFNDKIDYEEVDEYLKYPSRERMSSEWLKNNPINKAEKFLQSKRKSSKSLVKESKYTSLMVAEDFIVSRQLSKDSEYAGKTAMKTAVGTVVGAGLGVGLGTLAGSGDRNKANDYSKKYKESKTRIKDHKNTKKDILNKSGLSYKDQNRIKYLKKKIAKTSKRVNLSPEERKEYYTLKNKLDAYKDTKNVASTVHNTRKGSGPIGNIIANKALEAGTNLLTAKTRAKFQELKDRNKEITDKKVRKLSKKIKALKSKSNLTEADSRKLKSMTDDIAKIRSYNMKASKYKTRSGVKKTVGGIVGAVGGGIAGNKLFSEAPESDSSIADYYTESNSAIANMVKEKSLPSTPKILDLDKFNKEAKKAKRRNIASSALSTGAGASAGLIASSLLTSKMTKKYNELKERSNKTPEDIKKMKSIKRKLISIKAGSTLAGGIAANRFHSKYGKKFRKENNSDTYLK